LQFSQAHRYFGILVVAGVLTLGATHHLATAAAQQHFVVQADPVIAAAGDIACDETSPVATTATKQVGKETDDDGPGCKEAATARLLTSESFAAVLPLGDEQYPDGTVAAFMGAYDKTWGAENRVVRPVPGNHEYHTSQAAGYYGYFKSAAGDPSKGYYSWDLSTWHFIAINANCGAIGGCTAGSPEEVWLKADLAAHPASCTLAYWHQPRFSSGHHHSDPAYQSFWEDLYAAHVDVVLNGHDHDYERFAPQTPSGRPDADHGIREFVVGTGGKSHYVFTATEPNSEVRNNTTFGILKMRLHAHSYDWNFVPANGTFSDSGNGTCRGRSV